MDRSQVAPPGMSGTALQTTIGLLFSGGLDSSVLLTHLLACGERVQPIYVAGGLYWEPAELESARRFLALLASPRLESLEVLEMPLVDLYGDHWSTTGRRVPSGDSPDEAVYLPGRNPLLIIKARTWCQLRGIGRLASRVVANQSFCRCH